MVWDRRVGQSCLAHPPENLGLVSHCLVGVGLQAPLTPLPPRKHVEHLESSGAEAINTFA